jgi:hypothetical protein
VIVSDEPVRWITGRRSDHAAPGGRVVALVYRPLRQRSDGCLPRYLSGVRCEYVHSSGYMPAIGSDEAECIERGIWLVLARFAHCGVRDPVISLTPPDDESC